MKFKNEVIYKDGWDKLIYNLFYPSILGSMIYDLFSLSNYSDKFIAPILVAITIFYILDYIHLYGDMEPIIKKQIQKKECLYYIIDIFTSLTYYISFICVKKGNFCIPMISFTLISILIYVYKRKNEKDNLYFMIYFIFLVILFVLWLFKDKIGFAYLSDSVITLAIVIINIIIYGFYIFYYYDKYSKKKDEEIYS